MDSNGALNCKKDYKRVFKNEVIWGSKQIEWGVILLTAF